MAIAIIIGICIGGGVFLILLAISSNKLPLISALERYDMYSNAVVSQHYGKPTKQDFNRIYNNRLSREVTANILNSHLSFVQQLKSNLAITDIGEEKFVTSVIISTMGMAAISIVCIILLKLMFLPGLYNDWFILSICIIIFTLIGALPPIQELHAHAKKSRKHFIRILAVFVELVALGQAGGMGLEGALDAAASLSDDWTLQAIRNSLSEARAAGKPPWSGLEQLSSRISVPQLRELANSLLLAGTEGARVRRSLRVKANSLRRHQLADLESDANMVTEKLFLPSILLMAGFMLFISYPAIEKVFQAI